jgi:hypothetical protein
VAAELEGNDTASSKSEDRNQDGSMAWAVSWSLRVRRVREACSFPYPADGIYASEDCVVKEKVVGLRVEHCNHSNLPVRSSSSAPSEGSLRFASDEVTEGLG